ncbi:glycosyltransferase family 39 protein [Candidatus Kaiserbacteria bacterium]|nr:glycosyltransferase family 39 protein [Candidatus Kaiserbacteria bacterium]
MHFLRSHKTEICIFILAVVVRCLYFGVSYESRNGDLIATISGADGYYVISENLIHGNGYSSEGQPPYTLNSVRPPVYPYFLASTYLFFGSYWGTLLIQILIGSLLPLIGMAIARYIVDKRSISIVIGILLALEPFSILFSIFFYSETVFMLLFSLCVLYFFKFLKEKETIQLVLSAMLLGLSILTKPTAQYVPIIFAGFILWQYRAQLPRALAYTFGYALICLLVVSPWLYRNWHEFGVVGIGGQQGSTLYTILVPSVLAVKNGTTFQQEFTAILAQGGADPNKIQISQSAEFVDKSIPILLANPWPLSLTFANTGLNFFIHDGMYDVLKHVGKKPEVLLGKPALFLLISDPGKIFSYIGNVMFQPIILILVMRIVWIFITLACIAGVVRAFRQREMTIYKTIAAALIIYFMLIALTIGLAINARYRMPVNIFILTFAVYAAAPLLSKVRYRHAV